jgi:hypothetical protein
MRADQLGRWCARLALVSAFSAAAVAFAAGAASADAQGGLQEAGGAQITSSVTADTELGVAPQETDWAWAPAEVAWGVALLETDWA